jgi:transcriptional regulator with XRE-family HTH domain
MKASEYLDLLARHLSTDGKPLSDYRLSERLGITRQTASRYRNDKGHFDEETAIKAAELLDIHPASILADVQAERTRCPEAKEVWRALSKQMGRAAAAVVLPAILAAYLVIGMTYAPSSSASEGGFQFNNNIDYAKLRRRWHGLRAWLAGLFGRSGRPPGARHDWEARANPERGGQHVPWPGALIEYFFTP